VDHGRDAGEREVARPPRELDEAPAGRLGRDLDRGQDLVGLERGREQSAKERVGRDLARAARAGDPEARVEGEQRRGQLRGGIGVSQAAAERPLVPDRHVGHAAEAASSAWRVSAPIRSPPSVVRAIPASSRTPLTSTSTAGRTSRMLSIGTRLCPPARTLVSPGAAARSGIASARLAARA
jgi:hypothetical protein